MAVLKIACPRCGQRVSGDESFYGTSVDCPVCSSKIVFPEKPVPPRANDTPPDLPQADEPNDFSVEAEDDQRPKEETTSIPLDPTPAQDSPPDLDSVERVASSSASDEVPPSPLLGFVSMVAGILNVCTGCSLSLILAPVGIICGHLALARGRFSPIRPGRGMAIAGVILGYLGMLVLLIVLVLVATGVITLPFAGETDSDVPAIE